MGLKAVWTIVCEQCGVTAITERKPEDELILNYLQKNAAVNSYFDVWGPGIPDGWLQISHDTTTKKNYLFFDKSDCYKEWLRLQGRLKDLENFKNAVYVA